MRLSEVVLGGTLRPDGTLELDQKPSLSPGRVTVILRQETKSIPPPTQDWWQALQRIRAEREASGYPFMDEEALEGHIQWLREGDRIDELLKELQEQRWKPGPS
jgi:hypothetical protein